MPKPSPLVGALKSNDSLKSPLQPRIIPIRKDSQLTNGFGFNFCTIFDTTSSNICYSHIITSIDKNPPMDLLSLRLNDYILSINNQNIEYLNHKQLKDKLHRIDKSETILLLVVEKNIYQRSLRKSQMNPTKNLQHYRLEHNPNLKDYGLRV